MALLIHSPPETAALPLGRQQDPIYGPDITALGLPAPELMGILWAELPAPFPHSLVRHNNPA